MALFQRKRYVWNEPWFFQQRIRTAKSWVLFSLLLLAIAGGLGAILYFSAPAGKPINLVEIIAMSVGAAAAVWWILDGTETRRQAVLLEDSIVVGGDMGRYSHPTTYRLSEIPGAVIVMPEESKWPEPALFFHYDGEEQAIGIESKASKTRLAQALHDAGVAIQMDGWQPNQDSTFAKAFSWQADPNQVTAKAQMATFPPGTTSMMSVGGISLAIVRQCWAIVLWLLITGYAIYYGYQNWPLGVVRMALIIIIPIGAMYIAGVYTDRFACAATSQGLTRMAKDQIRKRSGIEINPDTDDLIPVEIFAREQFDKAIQRIHEMGFLQADPSGQRMLYEGKKERWCIPAKSIRSLAIEEVQAGTPGQSASGALNYYVVVGFATDEGDQEFGFRYSERDYGDFDDIKRAAGGIRVYEAFDSLLS